MNSISSVSPSRKFCMNSRANYVPSKIINRGMRKDRRVIALKTEENIIIVSTKVLYD